METQAIFAANHMCFTCRHIQMISEKPNDISFAVVSGNFLTHRTLFCQLGHHVTEYGKNPKKSANMRRRTK